MEENFVLSSSSTSNWLTIPPELLTMIFDKLAALNIPVSERRNSILRCREVHPSWKSVMDSNLERRSLEFYTKWKPFNSHDTENMYEFPSLQVVTKDRDFSSEPEWVHLPLQIYIASSSDTNSFFPTRSLTIRYANIDKWNFQEGYVVTKFMNIFSKCGAHLSSLNLHLLTLPIKTLSEILSNTINLKGITLNSIQICGWEVDKQSADLPALGQLETFRIFSTTFQSSRKLTQLNLYKLLLEPYSDQLVSIESDISFGNLGIVFLSLKMLTVQCPETGLLERTTSTFPTLQYLSLEGFEGKDTSQPLLLTLLNFASQFSKTLVELHVDVNRNDYGIKSNSISFDGGFNEKLVEGGEFPHLKKFSIIYPQHLEELAVVKSILHMSSNLEILRLLRFSKSRNFRSCTFRSFSEVDKNRVQTYLANENYWDVCRNLKSIVVESGAYGTCAFSTTRPLI